MAARSGGIRVAREPLARFVTDVLGALGMAEDDARVVADVLLFADARGVSSHGLAHLAFNVDLIRRGADPMGRPAVVGDEGGALTIDAKNAMGHVAVAFAMEQAIERARSTGVAAAAVANSNHCGAMGAYAGMAVDAGMVGIAMTNTLPSMAPWGGVERLVGNNPLAVGMPTGGDPTFLLDMSFSSVARGRLAVAAREGGGIPEGWALDSRGAPTTDPTAGLDGLLVPIGGPKGIGLSLVSGVLSSLLSGGLYGGELGSLETGPIPGRDGQFRDCVERRCLHPGGGV